MERNMITFEVDDMTCGHCVKAITEALRFVDAGARVHFDLASHRVQIEPTASSVAVLSDAIRVAGYTPLALTADAASVAEAAPRRGCCCG
jgi:copper chaperone